MQAEIKLEGVSLQLPIYDVASQSLKKRLVSFGREKISDDLSGVVVVQALSDINLTLKSGDSLGLIGRNGAGKSTLLRVLAEIYAPTAGKISVVGKSVPLLDISLGLDDQSTGRQNIRLRGLLLGMTSQEIEEKTLEIVDFTELDGYIDLPLRTYSAGMRVRLAFAISTAVDADILLLDEVLGVGDAAFQEKAKKRLKEFHSRAQIVVHAIHDEKAIRDSCNKALWLENGSIKAFGDTSDVVAMYNSSTNIWV
jgi:ABC-type polysaccharide/polyol phosphate transport system ATPase subunit